MKKHRITKNKSRDYRILHKYIHAGEGGGGGGAYWETPLYPYYAQAHRHVYTRHM